MAELPDVLVAGPVELRRWRPEHLDVLMEAIAASLPELRPWMPWAQELPDVEAERQVLRHFEESFEAGTDFGYGLYEPEGVLVGAAALHLTRRPGTAEIGYWVRSDRHRRGYATQATEALTTAALDRLPHVREVHVKMDAANAASARVPEKLGFRLLGEEDGEVEAPGHTGRWLRWSIDREGWRAGRSA